MIQQPSVSDIVLIYSQQLRDKGDLDEARREDISRGIEAASSVLAGTNDAIAREERIEAVEELKTLVEDWKGHRIEGFGELLLYGQYTVLKGESMSSKNEEREYKIFLFEMILLCCKEINVNKPKNKMSTRTLVTKDGKPKLQLKGRIFMQNVTETISLQKPGKFLPEPFGDFSTLTTCRLVYMSNFLERRSGYREFYHTISNRGRNEAVGITGRHATTSLEGPGTVKCKHNSIYTF
jgi:hypothetical protein